MGLVFPDSNNTAYHMDANKFFNLRKKGEHLIYKTEISSFLKYTPTPPPRVSTW